MHDLATRPWLGNVRELRNFVERALAFGATEALAMSGEGTQTIETRAPVSMLTEGDFERDFRTFREAWLDRGELEYLSHLLTAHGGVVSAAAQAAGLDRTYFYKLMRRHGLAPGAPPRG